MKPGKTQEMITMEQLKIFFNGHLGGSFEHANIVLYEVPWNDFGYHGFFEFHLGEDGTYVNPGTFYLHICKLNGSMKKRHELCNRYNHDISRLPSTEFIAFPSKELCQMFSQNYPIHVRKMIADGLCFNFGEGSHFKLFKVKEQYRLSILRNKSEEEFLAEVKQCKEILLTEQTNEEVK